jgi:hypothetical protein
MDEQLEKRVRFLREAHTEAMPHSDRGLRDHLLGTRQLLVEWGARPSVCDAGLFHSVYGTEHYEPKAIPLSMRTDVRRLIGDEAESLAWLFCIMRRDTFNQNLARDRDLTVQDWTVPARVVPNGTGTLFMITFFQPPAFSDEFFDQQTALVDTELAKLKEILESR